MSASTRDRMVTSTILLLREQGLTGTSVRDVIEHSNAPRGSIYHHFPGGKTQLVEEAMAAVAGSFNGAIEQLVKSEDPIGSLRAFIAIWRQVLEASDFRAGCPVVAVAAEAHDDADEDRRLATAAADVFEGWRQLLAAGMIDNGIARERALRLATAMIAMVEGAVVMCRARRDTQPLEDVGQELEVLIAEALPA